MSKKETTTKTDKFINDFIGIFFSTDSTSRTVALKKFAKIINELFDEPIINITQRKVISIMKEITTQIDDFCTSEKFITNKKFSEVLISGPVIPENNNEYSINSTCCISSEKEFAYIFLKDDTYDRGKKGGRIIIQLDNITGKDFKTHLDKMNKNNPLYKKITEICQNNDIHIDYVYYSECTKNEK